MKLVDLDAVFIKYVDSVHRKHVFNISAADGVMFQCPKCAQGKEVIQEHDRRFVCGVHYVLCWFTGRVSDDVEPKPGRWNPQGTGLDDLTFIGPSSVSVLLTDPQGCRWHGFIRNGEATLD